jgi:GNAT superfamily N-acetyltransferase
MDERLRYSGRMVLPAPFTIRQVREADVGALQLLMNRAIDELLQPFLSPAQLRASSEIMGVDTELIADGTYFVAEEMGAPVACGGWSRRATHFGGDHWMDRDARPLDPKTEAARVRAMYTHPEYARRGFGRAILAHCEDEAAAAGFCRVELVATLAGFPLYRACGYSETARFDVRAPSGIAVPLVRMGKHL